MRTHAGHVALVTGANKGIGFEIARQLGQAGCIVLLGARNAELGQKAAATLANENLNVSFIKLDLNRPETIHAAAQTIEQAHPHLDILVNNAGIADPADGPASKVDVEAVRRVLETNFIGSLLVTQAMLPLVQKSQSGRIVNVSSGLGSLTLNADPSSRYAPVKPLGYNTSKAALNMLTIHLAYELRETKIKVNSADPGYTATDLNGNSGPQTIPEGAAEAIRLALLPEDGPTGTYSDSQGIVPW